MASEYSPRSKVAARDSVAAANPDVLDLDHLTRYTVGNRELEVELLRLFRAQMRTQVTAIAEAGDADQWRFATHTLKGVARSIGAWAIADAAERLEQLGQAADGVDLARALKRLESEVAVCEHEIDRIIGRQQAR